MQRTFDLNVHAIDPLISPQALKQELPMRPAANETVVRARDAVVEILSRRDPRLLVIVGPCSIHDERAALEYAGRLAELATRVQHEIVVIMRVYFEKPRTTVGWRGMIIDPHLDYSSDIPEGLRMARRILLAINELGLPTATEVLDPIVPQYTADLVALGRRRGAHHRVADPSRDGQRAVDAGGLQELHRRQPAGGHRRHRLGARPRTGSWVWTRKGASVS